MQSSKKNADIKITEWTPYKKLKARAPSKEYLSDWRVSKKPNLGPSKLSISHSSSITTANIPTTATNTAMCMVLNGAMGTWECVPFHPSMTTSFGELEDDTLTTVFHTSTMDMTAASPSTSPTPMTTSPTLQRTQSPPNSSAKRLSFDKPKISAFVPISSLPPQGCSWPPPVLPPQGCEPLIPATDFGGFEEEQTLLSGELQSLPQFLIPSVADIQVPHIASEPIAIPKPILAITECEVMIGNPLKRLAPHDECWLSGMDDWKKWEFADDKTQHTPACGGFLPEDEMGFLFAEQFLN